MGSKAKMLKVLSAICAVLFVIELVLLTAGYQTVDVKHIGTAVLAALGAVIFFVFSKRS